MSDEQLLENALKSASPENIVDAQLLLGLPTSAVLEQFKSSYKRAEEFTLKSPSNSVARFYNRRVNSTAEVRLFFRKDITTDRNRLAPSVAIAPN